MNFIFACLSFFWKRNFKTDILMHWKQYFLLRLQAHNVLLEEKWENIPTVWA